MGLVYTQPELTEYQTEHSVYLLVIVVVFWGLSWYAITLQLGEVHPVVSVAWRFFIAAIVLFVWLKYRGEFKPPQRRNYPILALLGLCLFCANFISFYFATGYVTSGLISVVFAAAVFMTVLNQWVWARKTPAARTIVGAVFGVGGIALLFGPSIASSATLDQNGALIGLALSILGTWFFSVGNIVSATLSTREHLPSFISCAMLFGAGVSAIVALLLGEPLTLSPNFAYLAALAYLAIGASVIAFVAYLSLVATQGAEKAGYATVLFPIVALAVSTIFEGYQWNFYAGSGVVLATIGALIVFYPKAD